MPKRDIAYDVETTGLYVHEGARLFAFSECDEDWNVGIHRLDAKRCKDWREPQAKPKEAKRGLARMDEIWSDRRLVKVLHNAPLDVDFTEATLGRDLRKHPIKDTIAMSQILQNRHPGHALAALGYELAEYPKDSDKMVKRYTRGGRLNFQQIPRYDFDRYQGDDAIRTMLLDQFFWPKIVENGWEEIHQMECDLTWTVLDMKRRGVMLDTKKCHKLIAWLEKQCSRDRKRFRHMAGQWYDPGNDGHVRKVLYQDKGLPVLKRTDETKQPAVDKFTLAELKDYTDDPVIDIVLRFRSYRTGMSKIRTYLEKADSDGILHPDIRRTGAKTGRQSCSNPNLQNVSKKQVLLNPYPIPARQCFRPRPGYINLHIDFKGIEMRLLINASRDPTLMAVLHADGDVHEPAAKIFYGDRFRKAMRRRYKSKKWAGIYKLLRNAGKNANFAKPYGAGSKKIAMTLGLPEQEGARVVGIYEATFPDLCELSPRIAEEVREEGHIHTVFGRELSVPRDKAYTGTNYRIQGDAAGIMKRAEIRVNDYLREATGDEVGVLLPIHDELVIQAPRKRLKDLPDILGGIKERMVDFPQIDVPLDIDVEYCTADWAHLKDFHYGG
jgi:DNA polymerase-1